MSARHGKIQSALRLMRKQLAVPEKKSALRLASPASTDSESSSNDVSFEALLRSESGVVKPMDSGGRVELEHIRPPPIKLKKQSFDIDGKSLGGDATEAFYLDDVTPLRHSSRTRFENKLSDNTRLAPSVQLSGTEIEPPVPSLDHLSAQHSDAELFRVVIGEIKAIDSCNRIATHDETPKPKPYPRQTHDDEQAALIEALEGPISLVDHLDIGDEAVFLRHGVPRRVLSELRRGRWAIQAYLDLHGMTRDHARSALVAFLNTSLRRGHRCIRVVHGKGLGSPNGVSVLKQLSPGWLAQREEILAFCQAAPNQGGAGALLVLLRGSAKR